jgi:hypothetical protein
MSENKQMPEAERSEFVELTEKGVFHGSAGVVNMSPSDQFVPPTMNLDGPPEPPAAAAPASEQ